MKNYLRFFLIDLWTKKLDYIGGASKVQFSIFEVNSFIIKKLETNFFFKEEETNLLPKMEFKIIFLS